MLLLLTFLLSTTTALAQSDRGLSKLIASDLGIDEEIRRFGPVEQPMDDEGDQAEHTDGNQRGAPEGVEQWKLLDQPKGGLEGRTEPFNVSDST